MNKIEQYREIVNDAPEGANAAIIVEDRHYYLRFEGFKLPSEWLDSHKRWVACLSFADVNSIHWLENLRTIIAQHDRIAELEAKIDRLMLEHCPSEMTPEQIKDWENAIKIILD